MKSSVTVLSQRDSMLKSIYDLHAGMRRIVLAAGVPEQHYDKPVKDLEQKTTEELVPLNDWLQSFFDGPYSDVLSIWKLKPADWWNNMEVLFQQRKTREQKLLSMERKKLRKSWYKRHGEPDEEGKGQESVEDQASGSVA